MIKRVYILLFIVCLMSTIRSTDIQLEPIFNTLFDSFKTIDGDEINRLVSPLIDISNNDRSRLKASLDKLKKDMLNQSQDHRLMTVAKLAVINSALLPVVDPRYGNKKPSDLWNQTFDKFFQKISRTSNEAVCVIFN